MHRQTNRAALVGNGTRDRLADPPVHVRAEAESTAPVVLLDADLKADIALLHEVKEGQAAAQVAPSNRDNQTQVALDQPTASAFAILGQMLELEAVRWLERLVGGRQLAQGGFAGFEALRQRDLLLSSQQFVMGDFAEVHCPGTAGELFGQQPEPADWLSCGGFGLSLRIASLGQLGAKEFFSFVQKIKAHCIWLLLGPRRGVKKAAPTVAAERRLGAAWLQAASNA